MFLPLAGRDRRELAASQCWAKICKEPQEAIKAVSGADVVNAPSRANEVHRRVIHNSMMQALDAGVAIDHYLVVMGEEYGFSILTIYQEHRRKFENEDISSPGKKRKSAS